ncbi:hypothetical protein [Candidatus Poriferisodalis sp.]|uniref:hypothetical protein n=1 Tax=Candidatus Poriferisodalis sp. TaxID=3101277 RepID=UPI003AF872C5
MRTLDRPIREVPAALDALWAIFQAAATALPDATNGGSGVVTDVVMDHETFQRELAKLAGGHVGRRDPNDDSYRCQTRNGTPIDTTEATIAGIQGHVRRVVVGSDGVVIDLGRKQRLFTGRPAWRCCCRATSASGRAVMSGDSVPGRSHQTGRCRRVYVPRQRGTPVWATEPTQTTRLQHVARPHRLVAHLPARRHRDLTRPEVVDWAP